MASTDLEIQHDELDALKSILDDSTFEINEKTTTNETIHGTLIIDVTLPDQFSIQYHSSMYQQYSVVEFDHLLLDQSHRVEYLPPIFLRFTVPNDYPSISPPSFELECIWMLDQQVSIRMTKELRNHLLSSAEDHCRQPQ